MIEDPSDSPDGPSASGSVVRPMTLGAATAWSSGIVLAFWMMMVVIAPRDEGAASDLVGNSACQAIAYLLGLFLILQAHAPEASIRDFLAIRRTNLAFYPLAIYVGAAAQVPVQALYALISRRWPSPIDSEDKLVRLFSESTVSKRAIIGVLLVFLGPLIEEIFFRGALFRPLLRRYPAAIVVTLTSIFFAVSHGMPQMFIPIALVGAAIGIFRAASGSLGPGLLIHATFNAVPFYALTQAKPGDVVDGSTEMPPLDLSVVSSVAAIFAIGVACWLAARSAQAATARRLDRS